MAALLEAAVQAVELEAFSKDIPSLVPRSNTLYARFKKNAVSIPVSNVTAAGGVQRPSFRVPMRMQSGAAIIQGTGNADSLFRGSGSQWAGFAISPVFIFAPCEISFLSRIATEGRKRGLFNVQAQELENSFESAMQGLEALCQGDGSGTLDTIPSTASVNNGTGSSGPSYSSIVGLNNAFQFEDQQTVQVISSGGTNRGSFTISYVDPVSQTIYSAQNLPSGTTTTDSLVVQGAPGTAGGSILGLRYWQNNANTGTIGGLNRANYPTRLQTPQLNLSTAPVGTSTPWVANILLGRSLGPDNDSMKRGVIWYTGPDQAYQIGNLYLQVLTARIDSEGKQASSAPDMTPAGWPTSWGGHELVVGYNALPGRLDLFTMNTWYMGEMLPLELYDFGGGITVAPVPDIGTSGGSYLTSSMFVYCTCFNLANSNVRAGVIIANASIPTVGGYLV